MNKKLLWASYFGSIPIYFFVAYQYVVSQNKSIEFNIGDFNNYLFLGLFFLGVMQIFIAYRYVENALINAKDEDKKKNLWMLKLVTTITPALYGMILFMMNSSFSQGSALSLVSLIGMVAIYPRDND